MLDPSLVVAVSLYLQGIADYSAKLNPPPISEYHCHKLARDQGWDHVNWTPNYCFTYNEGNKRPLDEKIVLADELFSQFRKKPEVLDEPTYP